nr:hypothetical protein [Sphingomonas psychrotolerans]
MLHLDDQAFWEKLSASGQAIGGFATAIGVAVALGAALLVI